MCTVKALLSRTSVAACLFALLLGGCGDSSDDSSGSSGQAAPKKTYKMMAFSPFPAGFNDVTKAWFSGFDKAASGLEADGFTLDAKSESAVDTDPAKYLNFIQAALVQKPDGIVVIPNNAAGMSTGLQRIAEDGTKVVVMDQDVPNFPDKAAFVGSDNKKTGALAAKWLIDRFDSGKLVSNEIAILKGPPGTTSTDDRVTGFKEALAGSKLKVVSTLVPGTGCGDTAKAVSTSADLLSAHPNLGGIFTVCDLIGTGTAKALVKAGRTDVLQVSVGNSADDVKLIKEGNKGFDAMVAQDFGKVGETSIQTLAAILQGKQVSKRVTDNGGLLVSADNADDYLSTLPSN
jgi:ribose transport system substrate-binding protein